MTKRHTPADNIRAEMARQRLSQTALAEVLNISQAAVSRRLAGKTEFSITELASLAAWLGVPAASLLGEDVAA